MKKQLLTILAGTALLGFCPTQARAQVFSNNEGIQRMTEEKGIIEERAQQDSTVFNMVEQPPMFAKMPIPQEYVILGYSDIQYYIIKNLKYPPVAEENGISGRVVCLFIVEKDGSVSNVKVVKADHLWESEEMRSKLDPEMARLWETSLDREAIRVIKNMPRWTPGKQDGKPVRVLYTFPLSFRL